MIWRLLTCRSTGHVNSDWCWGATNRCHVKYSVQRAFRINVVIIIVHVHGIHWTVLLSTVSTVPACWQKALHVDKTTALVAAREGVHALSNLIQGSLIECMGLWRTLSSMALVGPTHSALARIGPARTPLAPSHSRDRSPADAPLETVTTALAASHAYARSHTLAAPHLGEIKQTGRANLFPVYCQLFCPWISYCALSLKRKLASFTKVFLSSAESLPFF